MTDTGARAVRETGRQTRARAKKPVAATAGEIVASALENVNNDQRQVGGDHYKRHGSMQPFNVIDHYGLDFYSGNALKYLLRFEDTLNVRDLEKCEHYIKRKIDKVKIDEEGAG